eukprot:TRINITY_DN3618_c0_g1_i3.p1 TRINITY_DN3618_c0_g1~~TRINITY_DN3618_c0_g1_i3.p1  ORF type:complete len:141 (-),score=48.32 TRINITY_DN3618_c0_g1_i3:43-465(-)
MSVKALEGDWEFISDKGYDPVKVSIKNIMGPDWIVACMIPKGNMMASMLKKTEDGAGFKLVNFNSSSKKETPQENKELEEDFKVFLEKGISNLVREDKTLIITAGHEQRILTQDDVLKKQEEAKMAKLNPPRAGGGRFKR